MPNFPNFIYSFLAFIPISAKMYYISVNQMFHSHVTSV